MRYPRLRGIVAVLLAASPVAVALAQQPAPIELPKPRDVDPGVDTSAPASTPPPAAERAPAAATPAVGAKPDKPDKPAAEDHLDLDTTQITGNQELPKFLYIVPWKRPDLGDLAGRPPNTLVDEVLAPVDRDVFQRENRYYDALKPEAAHPATARDTAAGRETETGQPAAGPSGNKP